MVKAEEITSKKINNQRLKALIRGSENFNDKVLQRNSHVVENFSKFGTDEDSFDGYSGSIRGKKGCVAIRVHVLFISFV